MVDGGRAHEDSVQAIGRHDFLRSVLAQGEVQLAHLNAPEVGTAEPIERIVEHIRKRLQHIAVKDGKLRHGLNYGELRHHILS